MKLAIVGQGAIGTLFAYYYRLKAPTLLVKKAGETPKQLLTEEGIYHNIDLVNLNVLQSNSDENSLSGFDAIIITVKGYQLAALIGQLVNWVSVSTRLILVQNGMGGAQLLAKAFPKHLIYTGTTTDAVYKKDPFTYQVTATGKLDIGPLWQMSSGAQYTARPLDLLTEKNWALAFFSNHPNYVYHEDIAPALFTKLAINAVINPLTATLNIKNGQLLLYPQQVSELKEEIFSVYTAANIDYSATALSNSIDSVIKSTRNNWSSMQQDVLHHRQTENETVLGFLLNLATQFELNTPVMDKLYDELTTIDKTYM